MDFNDAIRIERRIKSAMVQVRDMRHSCRRDIASWSLCIDDGEEQHVVKAEASLAARLFIALNAALPIN